MHITRLIIFPGRANVLLSLFNLAVVILAHLLSLMTELV